MGQNAHLFALALNQVGRLMMLLLPLPLLLDYDSILHSLLRDNGAVLTLFSSSGTRFLLMFSALSLRFRWCSLEPL